MRISVAQRYVSNSVQVNGSRIRPDNGDSHACIDETNDRRQLLDLPNYPRPKPGSRTQMEDQPRSMS